MDYTNVFVLLTMYSSIHHKYNILLFFEINQGIRNFGNVKTLPYMAADIFLLRLGAYPRFVSNLDIIVLAKNMFQFI